MLNIIVLLSTIIIFTKKRSQNVTAQGLQVHVTASLGKVKDNELRKRDFRMY